MISFETSGALFFGRWTRLVALILILILARSGRAEVGVPKTAAPEPAEASNAGSLFCTDPYQAICARADLLEVDGDARLQSIGKFHRLRALADLLARNRGWAKGDAIRLRVQREEQAMRKILLQAAQLEEGRIQAEFDRVRALLVEEIENAHGLSARRRDDYINRVMTVNWVGSRFFARLLDRTDSWTEQERDLAHAFSEICGNGLEINAFLYLRGSEARWNARAWGWDLRSTDFLVVCPGRLLEHDLKDPRSTLRLRALLARLLGHELAHSIDAGVDPAGYERYQSCMAALPSSQQLRMPTGDSFDENSWTPRMRVDSHAAEMVADQWGLKILGRMLESGELGSSHEQKLDSLQSSLARFCSRTGDDGRHPRGRYRIETLAGSEPSIRRAMGCAATAVPPEGACVW